MVEVVGSSTDNSAAIDQATWNGGENQQFQLQSISSARIAPSEPIELTATKKETMAFQNPSPGITNVNIYIEKDGPANLTLYDIMGRPVSVLLNANLQKGSHSVSLNSKHLAAGVYVLTLSQNNKRVSKRFVAQ